MDSWCGAVAALALVGAGVARPSAVAGGGRPAVGPAALSRRPWRLGSRGMVPAGRPRRRRRHAHRAALTVGQLGAGGRTIDLPPESFATGPWAGRVLVGADDGARSRLSLVDVGAGCATPLAEEDVSCGRRS